MENEMTYKKLNFIGAILMAISVSHQVAFAETRKSALEPSIYKKPFFTSRPLVRETDAQLKVNIVKMTTFPTSLDPRFFNADKTMRIDVRDRTIEIVNDLFKKKLNNQAVKVADIELFGSNAAYEWDDQADFGVHIFLNTAKDPSLHNGDVLDLDNYMRELNDNIEHTQEPQVTFRHIVVELTYHATRDTGYKDEEGKPQFSIWSEDPSRSNNWINQPIPSENRFDRQAMLVKSREFINKYNRLVNAYFKNKQIFDCNLFDDFGDEMKKYRGDELDAYGQRSNGNLVYRMLRRLRVNLIDTNSALETECENIHKSVY
jgi:hypothetical protein